MAEVEAVGGAAAVAAAAAWPAEAASVAEEAEEPFFLALFLLASGAGTEISSRPRPRLVDFWRFMFLLARANVVRGWPTML